MFSVVEPERFGVLGIPVYIMVPSFFVPTIYVSVSSALLCPSSLFSLPFLYSLFPGKLILFGWLTFSFLIFGHAVLSDRDVSV